jgi:hypothetical protein
VEAGSASTSGAEEAAVGDPDANITIPNKALFNTLRAIAEGLNDQHNLNPRRTQYFSGKSVSDPLQPRAGFVDKGQSDSRGCFYDPWGKQYNVVFDTDSDNMVKVAKY